MLEVIHSPKLEDLADQLAEQLRAQRRRQVENILQPIVVVVGHLGIARWLERRIAMRFGIFANVRFVLTGEWLNAQMVRFGVLKTQDAERFSVAAMTWAIYALLETPERFGLLRDTPLLERERFQLAAKLARLFSEYLIYRREWLLDFEQEAARAPLRTRARAETKQWQARLWCALSARLHGAHRAAKFHALLDAINKQAAFAALTGTPTYVFGLNHLPPDVLTLLEQLSEAAPVQVYFPNPCVEYWADVVRERFLAQRRMGGDLLQADTEALSGFDHFDVGHPLLASLGGHGQAYFAELSHATAHFTEPDVRHERAESETGTPPATPTLLAALQYGITHLQPDFAPETLRFDHSIQVFSAQSTVDELAQVKVLVLAALLADPSLQLDEIAIMTPTLKRYAPLLPAVFGAELCASPPMAPELNLGAVHPGPRAQSALRFSVLDLKQASASPLLEQLLQAPELRWEPAQLLTLMAHDALAPHFGLDANDLELAPRILQRAHIAFGFNDAHRRQLLAATASALTSANDAAPSASLHTWEAGLERLLFGYLHGNQAEFEQPELNHAGLSQAGLNQAGLNHAGMNQAGLSPAGSAVPLWPVPDIDVRHAAVLSAILQMIRALRVFNFGAQRARTLPEWTRWLERQIFNFTGAPAPDAVRAIFTQLDLDAEHAQVTEVSFIALREACIAALAQASQRITPALGAICVCGLVPMRALPFKVVCILGLNEAEFPKPELPDSLNLMRATGARRPGDRSRAQEDRYLFLEAIMAARSQLVLSYQGLNSDGKARLPCGVLTELLAQLQRQFGAHVAGAPWLVAAKPLSNAALRLPVAIPMAATLPEQIATAQHTNTQTVLKVIDLLRFWQQPLRSYVQQRLRLATQQTDGDQTPAEHNLEPLSLSTPPIERIEARLLTHALAVGNFPQAAPAWLGRSGYLASGALGVQSYASIVQDCRPGWLALKSKFPELIGARKQPVRVDLDLGSTRLLGYIPDVYLAQRACLCVSNKALHGLQRLRLLLQVLMMRAAENDPDSALPPWRAVYLGPGAMELAIHANAREAREYLANLIALRKDYLQKDQPRNAAGNCAAPPWFWPKLSYTAFSATTDPHAAVTSVIEVGKDFELANSGLKFFLPNSRFFDADSVEFEQFLRLAQTVFAPFAAPKQAAVLPQKHSPSVLSTDPPVRSFAVTKMPLPQPSSPPEIAPNTVNLEQFGHDDSADFDDAH